MNMRYRLLIGAFLPALVAGCPFYDVSAISADIALALFTDVNEEKEPDDPGYISFWDLETSRCIVLKKDEREIVKQLDAFERDKDFVILPTGEKYPVNRHGVSDEPELGPTAECVARQSD